jgi:molecular chaperone GrpE
MMIGRGRSDAASTNLPRSPPELEMADRPNKGSFHTDIPADAVEEALRSVERIQGATSEEGAEVAVEADGADGAARAIDAGSEREKSLAAQLELSQEKARETMERLKEAHDRYLRAAAELENYRKRAQKERDEVLRYGNEKLLKDLFPVVDALDRALSAAAEGEARAIDTPLAKGVKLIRSNLEAALGKHGVTSFSALGQPFDPAKHEALLQVATADAAPGTVVLEHARGFLLNDRLARPAMVGVAKPPEPGADSGGGGAGGADGGQG